MCEEFAKVQLYMMLSPKVISNSLDCQWLLRTHDEFNLFIHSGAENIRVACPRGGPVRMPSPFARISSYLNYNVRDPAGSLTWPVWCSVRLSLDLSGFAGVRWLCTGFRNEIRPEIIVTINKKTWWSKVRHINKINYLFASFRATSAVPDCQLSPSP